MDRIGFEPITHGLKVRRSTVELAVLTRFSGSIMSMADPIDWRITKVNPI